MMTATKTTTSTQGRDLILTRIIDAPREKVFQAWTDPELIRQWFAPKPWTTSSAQTDVRTGGSSLIVMRGPDGTEIPCPGVYLEVVPNERIVATDAFTQAWDLSEKAFMVLDLRFEEQDGKTKYTARVRHWNEADRVAHEKMGFHEGWTACTEQLAALVENP
ncbi:SRPBCC family protein [Oxalobacteraceae bacterium R-40]|uniref:SRPBCC family protein n=1 Tax=Keguizhuia sedimenti TaxID=3064264 RepID=A0ABU1BTZ1_9BURK|nr:SRPBCC family protein [Oxalobacteraceae bacterium R-40]